MGPNKAGGFYVETKNPTKNPEQYVWKWTPGETDLENLVIYKYKVYPTKFDQIQKFYLLEDDGWGALYTEPDAGSDS